MNKKFEFHTKTEKIENVNPNKKIAYANSIEHWIAFWRANPHRFARDYFQIKLKDFQDITVYNFSKATSTIVIATRGIGKSFLTALYACIMAVLYPNSKIVICCGVKSQAKSFISEKIEKELCNMSVMLRKEIEDFKTESEAKTVIFKNGSTITATNAHKNRRGLRATILIIDEAVMVEKKTLEKVCIPFLNTVRYRGYTNIREYAGHKDRFENQTIYLTSAWYKAHYFYSDYYIKFIKRMLRGSTTTKVFNFSYETPLRTGLLPESRVEEMKEQLDPISFSMEVESIFYGENENSFFKADEINNCRILDEIYYPPDEMDYLTYSVNKCYKYSLPKKKREIRLLSADIAISAGKKNDNSVYILSSLHHRKTDYKLKINHIESHNGAKPEDQALMIKRLFYDYDTDRMIIDANGIGMAVYNELVKETYDTIKKKTYPAWGAYNVDNVIAGSKMNGVHYVMYAMKASLDINHTIAISVKSDLISNKLELPLNDVEARYYLEDTYGYSGQSSSEQARLIATYRETNVLFKEMIDLDYTIHDSKVRIKEQGGNRKDRYSSLGYNVFLAHEILDELKNGDISDIFLFLT